jgi:hypothetical protein
MRRLLTLLPLLLGIALVGCRNPSNVPVSNTSLPQVEIELNAPIAVETTLPPTITPTPTVLADPVQLTATVWESLPKAPVLMYHRFNPQPGASSYRYTTSLADFERQLIALYDAGFSLVSLTDWLQGNIHLQEGRRPLIITIDDLFYADQISLTEDGNPAPYSGVGLLWDFAQEHPEFNFTVALFYNLGDKGYANHYQNGIFTIQDGWRQARAEAIAWSLDNGAIPLNHFYEHPYLNQLSPPEILWQLEENDKALRTALVLAGREDLIKSLPNILALPYVVWPETEEGDQVLFQLRQPGRRAGGSDYRRGLCWRRQILPGALLTRVQPLARAAHQRLLGFNRHHHRPG